RTGAWSRSVGDAGDAVNARHDDRAAAAGSSGCGGWPIDRCWGMLGGLMDQRPEISAVVPAYNEVESLPPLFAELRAALEATGRTWELIVVDDGSTDGTREALDAEAVRDPRVRAVVLERNAGQSAALAAGLSCVRGEIVVTLDADLQNDPADLPRLLAALENADVVSGVRAHRQDSWVRLVSSRIANAVRRGVLKDPVTDIGCSFKVYRREVLEGLPMFVGVHRFLPALCVFRGARFAEVQLHHRARAHGVSKYGVGNRLWRGLADLVGVQWLKSRLVRYKIRGG
ncbi:MAG TPA: glycosyltransferase family 2 protein, partial [Dongiaceae bacterium]|nr:glycosyltransferase family 2 protein [Dongiaceae bacterium]